jgi:MoaA/NifB/PqqE/SkfB family radical SAM enzyme
MSISDVAEKHQELILDGTKIPWHIDRIKAWDRGERIAPITIDMALTRACNYSCNFCYAMMQENKRSVINKDVIFRFLDDCKDMGVKGISLVSDGESTLSPIFVDTVKRGHANGISMAVGTNASLLTEAKLLEILPCLTYLRVNFSGGERDRYAQIMGVNGTMFDRVCNNIRAMMRIKKEQNLKVTIGMQMVLMPQDQDQILPLAKLGKELGVDYSIIKHCSDNEDGFLGVDYSKYKDFYHLLEEAEKVSEGPYKVYIKWTKIKAEGKRSYQKCYGPPFLIQLSGSGLVAPCGMLFNERYKKFHMGNICEQSFKEIVQGDRYWEVVDYLRSDSFNAQKMCGTLCLQHKVNEHLDKYKKGEIELTEPTGSQPEHVNFV